MNPRETDAIAELAHNVPLLNIRADNRFARNMEIIGPFRLPLALIGIFDRHGKFPIRSLAQIGGGQK